jgi:predicted phage terminase large subunit-like protein
MFAAFCVKWSKPPYIARKKVIEDKANGPAIEDDLKSIISGIILYDPKGESKQTRLEAAAVYVQSGNIYLPDPCLGKPWVNDFVEEVTVFPNGANDDQVDTFSQAILNMKGMRGSSIVGALTGR